MTKSVYAIATMDTKGLELDFVAQCLRNASVAVKTVDVGTLDDPVITPDVSRAMVADNHSLGEQGNRGQAVTAMGDALRTFLQKECDAERVSGVIGIGGSGGTALITAAMRSLDIGLPKVMLSTVASGNTAPYVDCSDITMMYSVVDVAGLNTVSRRVLANAAHAVAGMVTHPIPKADARPAIGMTMFGVTTPCVDRVRTSLEKDGFDCLVFHATGTGGRAMESLTESGFLQGVIDITTTEVADEVVGGVFPAGPQRFDGLLSSRLPLVISLGALDMVNFGAIDTVPPAFRDRKLFVHNAQVTLMRTNADENRQIARWIATKLNRSQSPCAVLIPEHGLSALDAAGQPFHEPDTNAVLFSELETLLEQSDQRQCLRLPMHINDPEFAEATVDHFQRLRAVSTEQGA